MEAVEGEFDGDAFVCEVQLVVTEFVAGLVDCLKLFWELQKKVVVGTRTQWLVEGVLF